MENPSRGKARLWKSLMEYGRFGLTNLVIVVSFALTAFLRLYGYGRAARRPGGYVWPSHSVLRRVVEAAILVRLLRFRSWQRTVLQQDVVPPDPQVRWVLVQWWKSWSSE